MLVALSRTLLHLGFAAIPKTRLALIRGSMNINIEIKVKMDKGKELLLKGDEAKELYLKLKEIYEQVEYVPYRYPWYIYTTTNAPQPWTWYDTRGNISVSYNNS